MLQIGMVTEEFTPLAHSLGSHLLPSSRPPKCHETMRTTHQKFTNLYLNPSKFSRNNPIPSKKSITHNSPISRFFLSYIRSSTALQCLFLVILTSLLLTAGAHPTAADAEDAPATVDIAANFSTGGDNISEKSTERLSKLEDHDAPRLQGLLRDLWHWRTQDSPEFGTMVGLNDNTAGRLDTFTVHHFTERKDDCLRFLSRAAELEESALSFEDQINLKIAQYYLRSYVDNFEYIKLYTPVTLLEGPHVRFPALVLRQMKLDSYDDFQKLLSRYGGFPRQVAELTELLQQNIEDGLVPHAAVLGDVSARLATFAVSVSESEFFKPFVDLPDAVSTVQRRTLRQQAQERIAQDVLPAFEKLRQFMEDHYLPAARPQPGLGSVEGLGKVAYEATLRYHTTTNLSPAQIHALGLTEVKRIQPLLRQALVDAGWTPAEDTTPLSAVLEVVRSRPDRYFQSIAALSAALVDACDVVRHSDLHTAFDFVPPTAVRVGNWSDAPLPRRLQYEGPPLEGSSDQATLTVDTSDLSLITKDEVRALALYWTLPGRQLLSEWLRRGSGVPAYRRVLPDVRLCDAPAKLPVYSAFVEGWSLYALYVGDELGLFDDPLDRLGRQSAEAVEAALMVTDTGLHDRGWTLEEAQTYLKENTLLSSAAITHALRRVLTWPGLATAAKVGEIKLKELRQKAVNALGELFRLQDFHQVVFKCAGPISILQLCVDHYILAVTTKDALEASSSDDQSEPSSHDEREAQVDTSSDHEDVTRNYSPASCTLKFWSVFYPLIAALTPVFYPLTAALGTTVRGLRRPT